jgi:hypothetical protein
MPQKRKGGYAGKMEKQLQNQEVIDREVSKAKKICK